MNGLLVLAFTAGKLAPVNPCGFALLPAWITHTLGEADTHPMAVRLTRALRTGAALTVGFAGTLVAAGWPSAPVPGPCSPPCPGWGWVSAWLWWCSVS